MGVQRRLRFFQRVVRIGLTEVRFLTRWFKVQLRALLYPHTKLPVIFFYDIKFPTELGPLHFYILEQLRNVSSKPIKIYISIPQVFFH